MDKDILNFIKESNKIEGISEYDQEKQYIAYQEFLNLDEITVEDIVTFALVLHSTSNDSGGYKPELRGKKGMDVRVGSHFPISGGPEVIISLKWILSDLNMKANPYKNHCHYEHLHPLTDCNGRTGRAIWAWQMMNHFDYDFRLGFLQPWYYMGLDNFRK